MSSLSELIEILALQWAIVYWPLLLIVSFIYTIIWLVTKIAQTQLTVKSQSTLWLVPILYIPIHLLLFFRPNDSLSVQNTSWLNDSFSISSNLSQMVSYQAIIGAFLVWLLVSLLILLSYGLLYYQLHRQLSKVELKAFTIKNNIKLGCIQKNLLPEAMAIVGLTKRPIIKVVRVGLSPYVTGLIRPTIVIPTNLLELEPVIQKQSLLHEMTHIKHFDHHKLWAYNLLKIAFWPSIWVFVAAKKAYQLRELLCDQSVYCNQENSAQDYCYSIKKISKIQLEKKRKLALNKTLINAWLSSKPLLLSRLEALKNMPNKPTKESLYSRASLLIAIFISVYLLAKLALPLANDVREIFWQHNLKSTLINQSGHGSKHLKYSLQQLIKSQDYEGATDLVKKKN